MEHVQPVNLEHDGVFDGVLDIYVGNEHVDLAEAQRLGVAAIFYRTAVGLIPKRDDRVAYHRAKDQALRLGLLWGAYYVVSDEDVDRQLDRFLEIEDASNPKIAMAIDWEKTSMGTADGKKVKEFVNKFRARTGFLPILYGGSTLREDPLVEHGDQDLGKCPLWYIYLLSPKHPHIELPAATWPHYTLWQFDDQTRNHGAPYPRDVLPGADWSRFVGSKAELEDAWPFRVR
jgi:GH25 family lysozyme M1 (1,4-beta-N-acetylmuramidase)